MTYELDPQSEQPEAPQSAESGETLMIDVACISCGYSLQGLRDGGSCPECGKLISESLRGDLFQFSEPVYVKSLYTGAKLVVASILLMVILVIASIGFQLFVSFGVLSQAAGKTGEFVAAGVGVLASFIGAYGWWCLSAPNPRRSLSDAGVTSRKLVRMMVVVNVIVGIVSQALSIYFNGQLNQQMAAANQPGAANTGMVASGMALVALALLGLVVFAIAFFAQMKYVQWMGPRLSNSWVTDRAKLMMWLGPLLYTVGALCIGLGPLVALILYYNLITRVRADLKHIVAGHEHGTLQV